MPERTAVFDSSTYQEVTARQSAMEPGDTEMQLPGVIPSNHAHEAAAQLLEAGNIDRWHIEQDSTGRVRVWAHFPSVTRNLNVPEAYFYVAKDGTKQLSPEAQLPES